MKFEIHKTSNWDSETPPLEDGGFGLHKKRGRRVKGQTVPLWMVEIKDLEELLAFQKAYGDIIIQRHGDCPAFLEIYDDYH